MGRRRKKVDAAVEAAQFVRQIDIMREDAWSTHQVVHLVGASLYTPALTPHVDEMTELRSRLQSILASEAVPGPEVRAGGYSGLWLWDPFDDDRPSELAEVESFAPMRSISERFTVWAGHLEDQASGCWYPAPGLEEWLLHLYESRCLGRVLDEKEVPARLRS